MKITYRYRSTRDGEQIKITVIARTEDGRTGTGTAYINLPASSGARRRAEREAQQLAKREVQR